MLRDEALTLYAYVNSFSIYAKLSRGVRGLKFGLSFHLLPAVKALARLRICAVSPGHPLLEVCDTHQNIMSLYHFCPL